MCFVGETHLRDYEEPDLPSEWIWHGLNRMENSKKGGGIGLLINTVNNQIKISIHKKCQEHMWCKIELQDGNLYIATAYFATGEKHQVLPENIKIRNCLQTDLNSIPQSPSNKFAILGDLNAHITELGGIEDTGGTELKSFCNRNNLEIVNTSDVCKGTYTWSRGTSKSAIDYVLASPNFSPDIKQMYIDEEGQYDIDSDHNLIVINCTLNNNEKKEEKKTTTYHHSNQPRWKVSNQANLAAYTETVECKLTDTCNTINYIDFTKLITEVALNTCGKTKPGQRKSSIRPKWFTEEIKQAIDLRKTANRAHRTSMKLEEPENTRLTKWKTYKKQKTITKKLIAESIRTVDASLEKVLMENHPSNTRKFWKYLKRHKKETDPKSLRNSNNNLTEDPKELESIILKKFGEDTPNPQPNLPNPSGDTEQAQKQDYEPIEKFTTEEITKALKKLKAGKAVGPDDIPNELLTALGPRGIKTLTRLLNDILQDISPVPETWKNAKVKLIHKGKNKDKQTIDSYRPIALLSAVYKLHTTLLKNRLETMLETSGSLGDMQYGFRKGRNASDCHFILSQLHDTAKRRKKPLYIALLDIKGAYDNVNRNTLWTRLNKLNIPKNFVNHIKDLYEGTTSTFCWQNIETAPTSTTKGVRQGCPLSTTLFIAYMKRLEDMLNKNNKGFQREDTPQLPTTTCNGIMFADDITILAGNQTDLASQLGTANDFAKESDFAFCENKSVILIFFEDTQLKQSFKIQEKPLNTATEGNLLGLTISSGKDKIYAETEKNIVTKAKRYKGIIKNSSRNSFNRSVVTRTLWKQVAVPSLTYINDIICYDPSTISELEKQQIEVGKFALGANYITPNTSIEGEMGWSTFEAREARSKVCYRGKMLLTQEEDMTKKVFNYTRLTHTLTSWHKRTLKLCQKYNTSNNLTIHNTKSKWNHNTKTEINKTNEEMWRKEVAKKESMSLYKDKRKPKWEHIYDNSLGSDLLFQARTGSLPTADREAAILGGTPGCKLCGAPRGDVTHILTVCPALQESRLDLQNLDQSPETDNTSKTKRWLGLSSEREPRRKELIPATKNLLQDWWKKAKNRQPYWRR